MTTQEGIQKIENNIEKQGKNVAALQCLCSNDQQIQIHHLQIKLFEGLFPTDHLIEEVQNKLQILIKIEQNIKR